MKITVEKAIRRLAKEFQKDADYKRAWVDNISICFQDAYKLADENGDGFSDEQIKNIADAAAGNFIDILIII